MYRLLNLRLTSLRQIPGVSYNINNENVEFKVNQRTSLFYKQFSGNPCKSCARYQSTVEGPSVAPQTKNKVRKRPQRKYYDLLVVTNSSIKQQKTSVKKLTWSDLKLLATTNLKLSELHKLKDVSNSNQFIEEHTYNNLTVIDYTPTIENVETDMEKNLITCDIPINNNNNNNTNEIVEQLVTEPEPDLLLETIPKLNSFQPEVEEHLDEIEPETVEIEAKIKPEQTECNQFKIEVARKTLASYVEMCSSLKMPQRGLNAILYHNNRSKSNQKYFHTIKDINIYNAVLKGFAAEADFHKVEEVVNMIESNNIPFNVNTYVAIFECLGRVSVKDYYLKNIRVYCKEALQNDYTFDRILNEGVFLNDQRAMVLTAMRQVNPNYIPNYVPPKIQYENHLVNHLNDEEQLIEPKFKVETGQRGGLFSSERLQESIQKQIDSEIKGYIVVKSIANREAPTEDVQKYRQILADHFKTWEEIALKAFKRDLFSLSAQKGPLNNELFLKSIPTKDFVVILVDEAKRLAEGSEAYSPTVTHLYRDLGKKVYARFKVLRKQKTGVLDKILKIHNKYCQAYVNDHSFQGALPTHEHLLNTRQQWQWAEHNLKGQGATLSMDHREWSPGILLEIGKFLYNIIIHDLKIDSSAMRNSKTKNMVPAFYTVFRNQGRIIKEEVKPHPVLSRLYRNSRPETLKFALNDVPMLCPPVPWTEIDNGGYLVASTDVIRLPTQATTQKQLLIDAGSIQLYPSFDALNQLAAVPWQVNGEVLDVMLEVFSNGGSSRLDVPEPPSSLPAPPPISADLDKAEKFKLYKKKLQWKRKKAEMYSLWCDCLYRLSLANHFRGDIFWLPHNMDFRGRVYPVPPHLNHLGSDLARSILVFAESRPLGPNGLDWLKLHLINLTGLKKRDSIQARLDYANEMLEEILDSAENPLSGRQWWTQSDEPWQTLACCKEIRNALNSPDPTKYESHFPIHQDGSCNGLQHYAALGRDSAGAFSVNLCPSELPQDVYSAVVTLVEESRAKDAAHGVEIAQILEGFVKRKVIKQTVMTTVYGVTRFGARLQIAKQLKDLDAFPKNSVWAASSYLTGKTFESLRTMFTSTREIQDWFTECARLISGVGGRYVEWVTPMGLPIVQPYFRYKSLSSGGVYRPFHMDKFEKPNVMKQKNAFPPNFIHSLDSSHMMLTSLNCQRAGITFVSVHDCYWTHPSTVHIMNKICREQFVALHSEPILENLSLFLTEKYSYANNEFSDDGSINDLTKKKLNKILRQLPLTGDFDITNVLQSVYFFS